MPNGTGSLVGGDDFAETIDRAEDIKDALDKGASHVIFQWEDDGVSLMFAFPPHSMKLH